MLFYEKYRNREGIKVTVFAFYLLIFVFFLLVHTPDLHNWDLCLKGLTREPFCRGH